MVGLTPKELRVMDLWDEGFSTRQIATRLDMPFARVSKIVAYYHDSGDHTAERNRTTAASAQLADAINLARAA